MGPLYRVPLCLRGFEENRCTWYCCLSSHRRLAYQTRKIVYGNPQHPGEIPGVGKKEDHLWTSHEDHLGRWDPLLIQHEMVSRFATLSTSSHSG